MSDEQIRDALERAADVVPDEDLSHTAWYAGRSRKRRTSRAWWGAGAAAAAAAVVGVIALNSGALSLPESGPAGTGGDESGATATAVPEIHDPRQSLRGEPTTLAFTSQDGDLSESGLEHSGVLVPWSAGAGSPATWRLVEEVPAVPVFPDGDGIVLTFDGGLWSVRGCGVSMQAPGSVLGSRVAITGEWDIEPDPDPGASCVSHQWLDAQRWASFLGSAPYVGQDGTTLVLNGSVGDVPLEQVAVGFARPEATYRAAGGPDSEGPARAATWDDLAGGWVAAPLEDLTAQVRGFQFVDAQGTPNAGPSSDSSSDPAVRLTSPTTGELTVEGCAGGWFPESWLLGGEDASVFADPLGYFRPVSAVGCTGPGTQEQALVSALLRGQAELTVHGDYLVIEGWISPDALGPPPLANRRPDTLMPATQVPDLERLPSTPGLLPEVMEIPGGEEVTGDLPALADDPVDRFTAAAVPEQPDSPLLVLGPDQRWRVAATDVGGVGSGPDLVLRPQLLDTSISPEGDWLAYRTEASAVILSTAGEALEFDTNGAVGDAFPGDFLWLDDDRLAVRLGEDRAMIIDAASGEVASSTWIGAEAELTPWQVAVDAVAGEPLAEGFGSGEVVLQEWDTAGALVEERPLEFTGRLGSAPGLAQDRVAITVTTQDPSVIEPQGWDGVKPESVDLVLAYDGAGGSYLNVLQVDPGLAVTPLRWVDRGTLVVQVTVEGAVHYLLWDSMNGGLSRLTQVELTVPVQGPTLGSP